MNSRALSDLHPIVATKVSRLIVACRDHGIELLILSTLRDEEEQAIRYEIGRSIPGDCVSKDRPMGHVVTDNRPGWSLHHYGLAVDFWPIVNSIVVPGVGEPYYSSVWRTIRALCADPAINLRHGAEWRLSTGRREWGHVHYTGGLSIEAIRAGETLPDVEI